MAKATIFFEDAEDKLINIRCEFDPPLSENDKGESYAQAAAVTVLEYIAELAAKQGVQPEVEDV